MKKLVRYMQYKLEGLIGINFIRNDSWRISEAEHLSKFIKHFSVDCIFDVGANEGQYALRLRKLGYRGAIISFEPNPHSAALLRKVAANDPTWYVEEVALSDSEGSVQFNINARSQFSSLLKFSDNISLIAGNNETIESITIETSLLSTFFQKYYSKLKFNVPFLKMDTQGNDLKVAIGAGAALDLLVGLQSELSFMPIYDDSPLYFETLEFFKDNGFNITAIFPNNQGHFPNLIEMDCIMHNPKFNRRAQYVIRTELTNL